MSNEEKLVKSNSDVPAVNSAKGGQGEKKPRKKLLGSLISICIGGLRWFYGFATNLFEQIKTIYNAQFGKTSAVSSSDFALGGDSVNIGTTPTAIIIGVMAIASLLIIFGLISLIKRVVNNITR